MSKKMLNKKTSKLFDFHYNRLAKPRTKDVKDQENTTETEERSFSMIWKKGPTLFLWLRHFGCTFFSEMRLLLPELIDKAKDLGIQLTCIVQGSPEEAQLFMGDFDLEVVPDPQKKSYRKFGLDRTPFWNILFPSNELKKRRQQAYSMGCSVNWDRTKLKNSDPYQLPGACFVDKDGIILWSHKGKHTGDLEISAELMTDLVTNIKEAKLTN